jgi:lactoylglutathione lyase
MGLKNLTPNIMVADVNKTIEFYDKILGFDLFMSKPESGKFDWALVANEGVHLMFQEENSLKSEYPQLTSMPIGAAMTLFIEVDNIEEYYESIKDKVKVIKDLCITFYGMTEFSIEDYNGYILTFAERKE